MAITSTVIGNLGAGKVTESRFTFTSGVSNPDSGDINSTWNIPSGRHVFFWHGVCDNFASGKLTIDGLLFDLSSGTKGQRFSGYMYVDGPKTIQATGTGVVRFREAPYANWIRVAD